jgi:hypothetical protein
MANPDDEPAQLLRLHAFDDRSRRMKNIEQCLDTVRLESVPRRSPGSGRMAWRRRGIHARIPCRLWHDGQSRVGGGLLHGTPTSVPPADQGFDFSAGNAPIPAVSLEEVKALFSRYDFLDDGVKFLPAIPIALAGRRRPLRIHLRRVGDVSFRDEGEVVVSHLQLSPTIYE